MYREAAVRNIEFALGEQLPKGWFKNNCLNNPNRPLPHPIAYALRGVLEAGIALHNSVYISAVRQAADALLAKQREDGSLAGRFNDRWEPAVEYSCLTGNAQMGTVWGRLYQVTGDGKYLNGMAKANRFLKRVQWLGTGNPSLDDCSPRTGSFTAECSLGSRAAMHREVINGCATGCDRCVPRRV